MRGVTVLLAIGLWGCGTTEGIDGGVDGARADAPASDSGTDASEAPDAPAPDASELDAPPPVACASNADCPEAWYCDWSAAEMCGEGGSPGRCEPRPTSCPDTVATVCGCDGEDHRNPCVARRAGTAVASDGACPRGASCTAAAPCVDGACEGGGPAGCEVTATWSCREGIACTDDAVEYCGCDDRTFTASSTCPDRPYRHPGACVTSEVNCNVFEVLCFETALPCPGDLVREVIDGCWGQCVRLERCACAMDEACPFAPDENVCDIEAGHCVPAG